MLFSTIVYAMICISDQVAIPNFIMKGLIFSFNLVLSILYIPLIYTVFLMLKCTEIQNNRG